MKRLFYVLTISALAALAGVLPACDDDDPADTGPTTGTVSGTVTFQGTWPTTPTSAVQVSIFASFPPTGAPDDFTDPIAPTGSYDYRFDGLTPGTYAAIVVGWRDTALPPGNDEYLGFHWAFVDSVAVDGSGNPRGMPVPVSVQAGQTVDADIAADLDVAP
jgi:hypothetical protein